MDCSCQRQQLAPKPCGPLLGFLFILNFPLGLSQGLLLLPPTPALLLLATMALSVPAQAVGSVPQAAFGHFLSRDLCPKLEPFLLWALKYLVTRILLFLATESSWGASLQPHAVPAPATRRQ